MSEPRVSSTDGQIGIGLLLLGGPRSGALVRDVRLANELASRGFNVHAWWAMDRPKDSPLDPAVREHWLFSGTRFLKTWGREFRDQASRRITRIFKDRNRNHVLQQRPQFLSMLMRGLMRQVCAGVEQDEALVARFASELDEHGITHLLPMLEVLCPFAAAGAARVKGRDVNYLVTFQGYELYVTYAREVGLERAFYKRLAELVDGSPWPAVAVSEHYLNRVVEDVGIPAERLRAIPPGVPLDVPLDAARARELVKQKFPAYRPELPLISYFGRRDAEKGIDLLLYAANILKHRGVKFQLAVSGPTLFGAEYARVCNQIATNMSLDVLWARGGEDLWRSALYLASRCVVYPSIHGEPFGMVPVEAMTHGTPVLVPDFGGVAGVIHGNGATGGLHFRAWDSGDLAEQLARLVTDDELHGRLAAAAPIAAEFYSVKRLADRVLAHLGLPMTPSGRNQSGHASPPVELSHASG